MSRILFADLLQPKLAVPKEDGRGTYWDELQSLMRRYGACPADWVVRFNTKKIRWERQYDKYEQALTYYLLAALSLATDQFRTTDRLMRLFNGAYLNREAAEQAVALLAQHGWAGVRFEALLCPTEDQRAKVRATVSELSVSYLREVGGKKPGVRYESATHVDAFVGEAASLVDGGGDVGLGIEAKFTSDIDCQTTYSPHRNQLIRTIEVGHSRFRNFLFLLVTPRVYRERKSRFYVFKMEEYLKDDGATALQRDALITPAREEAENWRRRIGWLAWEDIVEVVFRGGQPGHPDAEELARFLRDRRLLG